MRDAHLILSQVLRENEMENSTADATKEEKEAPQGPGVGWGLDLDRRLMTNITEPSLAIFAFVCVTFILVYTKTIAVPFVLPSSYSALVPLLNWFVAKFKLPELS